MPTLLCAAVLLSHASPRVPGQLIVEGSDTMLPLLERLADGFHQAQSEVRVVVRGGGTRVGIQAFAARTADVAAASRRYTVDEISELRASGREPNAHAVALDGLAVVVRSDNPIAEISVPDLRRIYLSQVRNWRDLGASNEGIVPLSRDANSGTHDVFRNQVLRGQEWGLGVRFVPSTATEVARLREYPGAIAYGGIAYFRGVSGVKLLKLMRSASEPATLPEEEEVRSKRYPLSRQLWLYTDGKPRGNAKKFLDFVLSPAGQKRVAESGYFPLRSTRS
jgi:phosphate transport system substrate-binding protein